MMYLKMALCVLGLYVSIGWAQSPHQHGVAQLQIGIFQQQVSVELLSPADNIVGFEKAPLNTAQQHILADKLAKLNSDLFRFNPEAGCALSQHTVTTPFDHSAVEMPHEDHAHDKQGKDTAGTHADISASYVYICQNPAVIHTLDTQEFFTAFTLKTVKAVWVGDKGQSAATLQKTQSTIQF